ncbi:MAG: TetR/AcrR family transcriptional regulator [Deltaproteobacteria bacterium]|nr:TetR/AcrR family transcriptional regulator [Deltaproteobacteria bacterium]
MARPVGRTNSDYEEKRTALLVALQPLVFTANPSRPSLRELAKGAGVQPNTLRHYFGDRAGVLLALIAFVAEKGRPYLDWVGTMASRPPEAAIPQLMQTMLVAWNSHFGEMLAGALAEGMGEPAVGPAYLDGVLDPTLRAVEALLQRYVEAGALPAMDVRTASMSLIAPVYFALMHQGPLGGSETRPMELEAMVEAHVAAWLRGWGQGATGA